MFNVIGHKWVKWDQHKTNNNTRVVVKRHTEQPFLGLTEKSSGIGSEHACLKGSCCSNSTYPTVKMENLSVLFHFASKSRILDSVEFKSWRANIHSVPIKQTSTFVGRIWHRWRLLHFIQQKVKKERLLIRCKLVRHSSKMLVSHLNLHNGP